MAFISMVMERDMITKAIRFLFSWIDFVVYNFVSVLMQAIFDIANFTLSEEIFNKLIDRVYLILGIFMLFKLTISLFTYLVNPDKISDKEAGIGKLSVRTILVLVMLIMIPAGFQLLTDVQNALLPALPKIIMGRSTYSGGSNSLADDMGNQGAEISWSIFQTFFYNSPECNGDNYANGFIFYTKDGSIPSNKLSYAASNVNLKCQATKDGSMYEYEYTPFISTIAGAFLCYVLIGVCITVAIRMFKLMILRMIAPIAIISYIDPKSSKDGAFNSWTKTLVSTWTELFINLGVIYLVIFAVNELLLSGTGELISTVANLGFIRGSFFTVFVILGLFMFAKQAPKFLMDSLGIKSKGNFGKTMGLAASTLGLGGAAIANTRAAWKADTDKEKMHTPFSAIRNVGAGLFGGLAATASGGSAALNAEKDHLKAAMDARDKHIAGNLNRISSGSTALGRTKSSLMGVLVGQTPADIMRKRNKDLEDANKALKDYKSTIESRFDGNEDFMLGYNGHSFNWLNFQKNANAADNGDEAAMNWLMSNGFATTTNVEEEYDQHYMEEYDEEYMETYSEYEDVNGEWIKVEKTRPATRKATRPATRKATRTVTKQVADLDRVRAEYEKIHKEGYKQFEAAVVNKGTDAAGNKVADSVVSGKLIETQDTLKGIVVDKYNEYGEREEGTINLSEFNGGYGNTKATIGSVSGTQRDYTRDPKYKAAMVDEKESKKN